MIVLKKKRKDMIDSYEIFCIKPEEKELYDFLSTKFDSQSYKQNKDSQLLRDLSLEELNEIYNLSYFSNVDKEEDYFKWCKLKDLEYTIEEFSSINEKIYLVDFRYLNNKKDS